MRAPLALLLLLVGCDSAEQPEPNHPPFVVSASPGVGDIITVGSAGEREVEATLSDDNVNDHLFVRFFIDYPNGNLGQTSLIREVELPPSGTPIRANVHMLPNCAFINLGAGQHRLMMSVSDRPYLDFTKGDSVSPEAPLDSVPVEANRIRVVWLLNCP
jgi:hypothetical protein